MQSSILLVSSDVSFGRVIARAAQGRQLRIVRSYRDALAVLGRWSVSVVFCDDTLTDGNWKDLLGQLAGLLDAPFLVVLASTLSVCAEAVSLGAMDVVMKPVCEADASYVISRACRSSMVPAVA